MTIISNVSNSNQNNQHQQPQQQVPLIRKKLIKNDDLEKYYIDAITSFCNEYKYSFDHRKKEKTIIISFPHNMTSEKVSNEFNSYKSQYLLKWLTNFLQNDNIKNYHIAPQLFIESDNIKNKLKFYWH